MIDGLSLRSRTPLAWGQAQFAQRAELLVEQAHLEKKAASAALGLLFRLDAGCGMERELSALAREELVHFERALKLGAMRGVTYRKQQPSGYAGELKQALAGLHRDRLLGELLLSAVVELRSAERLQVLATAFAELDPELAEFYGDLVAAETRHGPLYYELACTRVAAAQARELLAVALDHEATVLREQPFAPRLHSGHKDMGRQ